MEKIRFSTMIDARPARVWQILWDDETYRIWTGVFSKDGSYAVSDWNEGSKILFLTDKKQGMFSMIEKKIPNEFISFKHLGNIKNGEEVPFGSGMEEWANSVESYLLKEIGGKTELTAEMDSVEAMKGFFMEKFPAALAKVKELSETSI